METVLFMFIDSGMAMYLLFEKVVQCVMIIAFLAFIATGTTLLSTMELRYDYDPVSGVGIYGKHPTECRNECGATLLGFCVLVAIVGIVAMIAKMFPEVRVLIVVLGLVATFPTIMLWYAIKMKSTSDDHSLDNEPLYYK